MPGEAKNRETMTGYLTRKEQITLGMVLVGAGRADPNKPAPREGNREKRNTKLRAMAQLRVDWVVEQFAERDGNPEFAGKRAFDPEQATDERVVFTIDRDVLGWVLDELDAAPAGGLSDLAIQKIEDRLFAMSKGRFEMPEELQEAPPANGVGRSPDGTATIAAAPPA